MGQEGEGCDCSSCSADKSSPITNVVCHHYSPHLLHLYLTLTFLLLPIPPIHQSKWFIGGHLLPIVHLEMFGDSCHDLGGCHLYLVLISKAHVNKHLTMYRTVPTTKKYLIQIVNSAELKKLRSSPIYFLLSVPFSVSQCLFF